jgi:hypothetical protein
LQVNWICTSCAAQCSVFGSKGTSRQARTTGSVIDGFRFSFWLFFFSRMLILIVIPFWFVVFTIVCTPFFMQEIECLQVLIVIFSIFTIRDIEQWYVVRILIRVEERTTKLSSSEPGHTNMDLSQFEALTLNIAPPTAESADRYIHSLVSLN